MGGTISRTYTGTVYVPARGHADGEGDRESARVRARSHLRTMYLVKYILLNIVCHSYTILFVAVSIKNIVNMT